MAKSPTKKLYTLSDILGEAMPYEEAVTLIEADPEARKHFNSLSPAAQQKVISFIQGNTGLKILGDKCFKEIISPKNRTDRLDSMLSAILGENVTVQSVLPREGIVLNEKGSFVVMDILVQLENGTFINVEVQRVGYLFPGARSSCYLADLVMRQYNMVRSTYQDSFSYNLMNPIILIVLMENSSENFAVATPHYIHREQITYDSNAVVKTLTQTIYISLDTFRSVVQNINTELDAWLTFLGSDSPADIVKLVNAYPEFIEYYKDIVEYRRHPKELMNMFSEALAIMDRNMEKYMIDEWKAKLEEQKATIQEQESTIQANEAIIQEKESVIQKKESVIQEKESVIQEKESVIQEKEFTIQELKAQLKAALDENAQLKNV